MKPIFPKPETLNATPVTMEREAYQAALELGAGRPVDKDFADRCYASNTCAGAALATLAGKDADTPHAMIGFPRFAAALQSLVTMSGDKPYSRSTLEHAASVYPTARAAFKALSGEGAAPLDVKTAQMIFAEAVKAWEAAEAAMDKAARDLLIAGTADLSARYPRREVQVCSAMGSISVSISPGGWNHWQGDYNLNNRTTLPKDGGSTVEKAIMPDWLNQVFDVEDKHNIRYALGGSILTTCKGGKVVRDLRHW
jgi:hypothetical protein